jgi:hypothetical protein
LRSDKVGGYANGEAYLFRHQVVLIAKKEYQLAATSVQERREGADPMHMIADRGMKNDNNVVVVDATEPAPAV